MAATSYAIPALARVRGRAEGLENFLDEGRRFCAAPLGLGRGGAARTRRRRGLSAAEWCGARGKAAL